jgi:nucleotide-binding universal stress UspA family protein
MTHLIGGMAMTAATGSRRDVALSEVSGSPPTGPPAARTRDDAPIVAGVDASPSGGVAARTAIAWARHLSAPLVFVYVRRSPSSALGEPYYQRRLEAETLAARGALSAALAAADEAGVSASAEVLDGRPAHRLVELARLRGARLLVTGRRRRRLSRSVGRTVQRLARNPVLVATA